MGVDREAGNPRRMFEYQAPAVLNQAAPVQNSWYWILGTGTTGGSITTSVEHCRVYKISVNVEDTNEDLELMIVIDGETLGGVAGVTATHSTDYYGYIRPYAVPRTDHAFLDTTVNIPSLLAFVCEGHAVAVAVRKTTATGVGNLTGIVMYGVLRDV